MSIFNNQFFIINKKMLLLIGHWPSQDRLKKYLLRAIILVFIWISMVPQILSMHEYSGVDLVRVMRALATLMYIITVNSKMIICIYNEDKLQKLYKRIERNWTILEDESEKEILLKFSKQGRFITIGYVLYMLIALIVYAILPAWPFIMDLISPLENPRLRTYILDGEFLVDRNEHFGNIFIFESCTVLITATVFTSLDSMFAVCVQHCIGLMKIVNLRIKRISERHAQITLIKRLPMEHNSSMRIPSSSERSKRISPTELEKNLRNAMLKSLIEAVQLHEEVLDFTSRLESLYATYNLSATILNVFMSVGASVIVQNLNRPYELIRLFLLSLGFVIHMMYLIWPGQKLLDSSESIFHSIYNIDWYDYPVEIKKLLLFFMLRSNISCKITAGKMFTMDFQAAFVMAKMAVSYIMVFATLGDS